jgi:hypothetical protein
MKSRPRLLRGDQLAEPPLRAHANLGGVGSLDGPEPTVIYVTASGAAIGYGREMGGLDLRPRILNMRTNMIVLTSAALLLSVTALQSPAMADRRRQCIMRHYFVLKKLDPNAGNGFLKATARNLCDAEGIRANS